MGEVRGQRVLRRVERAAQLLSHHLGARLGGDLTEAEAHVLFHLEHLPPGVKATPRELVRAFGLRPSTLTAILDRLERQGLVERRPNPDDRRSLFVAPTSTARAAIAGVTTILDYLEASIGRRVTTEQLAGFYAVLDALEASLE